jgi:hypothetical protein
MGCGEGRRDVLVDTSGYREKCLDLLPHRPEKDKGVECTPALPIDPAAPHGTFLPPPVYKRIWYVQFPFPFLRGTVFPDPPRRRRVRQFDERARENFLWKSRLYRAKEIDVVKKDAGWARRSAGVAPSSHFYDNRVLLASLEGSQPGGLEC